MRTSCFAPVSFLRTQVTVPTPCICHPLHLTQKRVTAPRASSRTRPSRHGSLKQTRGRNRFVGAQRTDSSVCVDVGTHPRSHRGDHERSHHSGRLLPPPSPLPSNRPPAFETPRRWVTTSPAGDCDAGPSSATVGRRGRRTVPCGLGLGRVSRLPPRAAPRSRLLLPHTRTHTPHAPCPILILD